VDPRAFDRFAAIRRADTQRSGPRRRGNGGRGGELSTGSEGPFDLAWIVTVTILAHPFLESCPVPRAQDQRSALGCHFIKWSNPSSTKKWAASGGRMAIV
jgi:hypothetical protein